MDLFSATGNRDEAARNTDKDKNKRLAHGMILLQVYSLGKTVPAGKQAGGSVSATTE